MVTAFVLYLNNLFEPIQQLTQVFNTFQQAVARRCTSSTGCSTRRATWSQPDVPPSSPPTGALVVERCRFRYAPELAAGAATT